MDDYDNRVPTAQNFPDVPFFQTLNLQGRLQEASVVYGMQPEQLETAVHLTFGREIEVNVQANERFARHFPAQRMSQQQAREILLSANPSAADFNVAEQL
eukprot:3235808-Amphidinium_carterae.1